MFDLCHLHIGFPKTGTTSIQDSLAASEGALAARGIHYARLLSGNRRNQFAVYAQEDGFNAVLARNTLARQGNLTIDQYRAEFPARFEKEIARSRATQLIVSNELLSFKLTRQQSVERVRDFLARYCARVRVIVYLRRQDRYAVSLFNERLKAGGTALEQLEVRNGLSYRALLEIYMAVFGREAIVARVFDRAELVGGDAVADFYALLGLADLAPSAPEEPSNASMSVEAQRFLAGFNRIIPKHTDERLNPRRGQVERLLRETFPGNGLRFERAAAEAYYRTHSAENDWLRATFFPERERLFDEDFSAYPERVAAPAADAAEAMIAVGATLYQAKQDQLLAAKAEILALKAELAWRDGRRGRARALWQAAADGPAPHAGAHARLSGLAEADGDLAVALAHAEAAARLAPGDVEHAARVGRLQALVRGSAQE